MNRLFLLFSLFFCGSVSAQLKGRPLIDSLVAQLPAMKEDSMKVKALSRIAVTFMMVDPLQGFSYAEKGLALSEKIHWIKGVANLHNNLGLMIGDTGNNKLAREHFEKSFVLNKELGSKINQVNNLNNIGRSYQRESDYSRAIDNLYKALTIAEEIKDDQKIALVCTNLGSAFYAQKNYAKANEYGEMGLTHAELAKSPDDIGKTLSQLGTIRIETGDTIQAKVYMKRALKVYEDVGNQPQIAQILTNMANLEYPDYKKAIGILQRAQAIHDAAGPASMGAIFNLGALGRAYYDLAMQRSGGEKRKYLQESSMFLLRGLALARQTDNAEYEGNMVEYLAKVEEEKGNYKEALQYYKSQSAVNDSLFSQDKKNTIAEIEGKHNIALKDDEIAIARLTLSNQRRTELGLIVGLLLAAVIVGLLYWQGRSRKKTNTTLMVLNSQLDEANKVKARFFGILSHDLRSPVSNLIHFLDLQKNDPGLMTEEQRVRYQATISQSAENLLNTMEDMLVWSKEQMDHFTPDIRTVAVGDLFEYIRQFFAATTSVAIRFDYAPGLSIPADENYLRIIMQNLTANAVKALANTPDARIEWKAFKEGEKILLSITDNGPGISGEQVKALYEDSAGVNSKTGFGMHLIRDLAKAIRYTVSISSQPGQGTTFTLQAALG